MIQKRNNYAIQAEAARARFLTYDQSVMPARRDESWLYLRFCGCDCRISRTDGHIFRPEDGQWLPADSHGEVLTIFDYLCDAKPGRRAAGEFTSIASLGGHVHRGLSIHSDRLEQAIDRDPDAFRRACLSLGGMPEAGGDLCYLLKLFADLPVLLRFWHSDEEFGPKLDLLWDKNTLDFLRYETTWFAAGVLRERIFYAMQW